MGALPDVLSPCRINQTGEGRRHYCSSAHAQLVHDWQAAISAWQAQLHAATWWPEQEAEWAAAHPPPTLRAFLTGGRVR